MKFNIAELAATYKTELVMGLGDKTLSAAFDIKEDGTVSPVYFLVTATGTEAEIYDLAFAVEKYNELAGNNEP